MLPIRESQMSRLVERQREAFIGRLVDELTDAYPELMQPLPAFVRITMVGNGLERAASFGLADGGELAHFVALQCASGAGFWAHPAIAPLLTDINPGDDEGQMDLLVELVPQEVWEEVEESAGIDDWFDPEDPLQRSARIAAHVCSLFAEVAEAADPGTLVRLFEGVSARGADHGIGDFAGLCVYAAALLLYGNDVDQASGPDWAKEAFEAGRRLGPEELTRQLRVTIALDTDCLV